MAIAEREIAPRTEKRLYTEEEYLALEEAAEGKSEYIHGEICPMSGGTDYHAAIPMSLGAELRVALRGRGCLVMSSDMKVYAAGDMYYPELTVVCGPRQYHGGNRTVITNPLLVAEVLSPSTERKDRGEKFQDYMTIESLMVYLLVSQNAPRVEQFSRAGDGRWDYTLVAGLNGILPIPALGVTLALADIYAEIDFMQEAAGE